MTSKGFTIIELVISIFILSIAVISVFSAFSVMTILTSDVSDRFAATCLAQEGMEIIRNIRDTNWIKMNECASNPECVPGTNSWVDGLTQCSSGCEADYTTDGSISHPLTPWNKNYLEIDSGGFYSYSNGKSTKFARKIIIQEVQDINQQPEEPNRIIKVTTQVSWDKKADMLSHEYSAEDCDPHNCITASEFLYDWYNYVNQ